MKKMIAYIFMVAVFASCEWSDVVIELQNDTSVTLEDAVLITSGTVGNIDRFEYSGLNCYPGESNTDITIDKVRIDEIQLYFSDGRVSRQNDIDVSGTDLLTITIVEEMLE
ncbi:MAG: hypothetical protein PQJ58_04530 [Spirochaetales bacterium]|nr:hypothetical protein [Spirochaetales bacterium]